MVLIRNCGIMDVVCLIKVGVVIGMLITLVIVIEITIIIIWIIQWLVILGRYLSITVTN